MDDNAQGVDGDLQLLGLDQQSVQNTEDVHLQPHLQAAAGAAAGPWPAVGSSTPAAAGCCGAVWAKADPAMRAAIAAPVTKRFKRMSVLNPIAAAR